MYGVRSDPALAQLENALLLQVCFGQNEVILNFDDERSVTVMVDIGISANQYRSIDPKYISSFLVSLLGRRLTKARALDGEVLEIVFDNGKAMHLVDETKNYESIVIKLPGSTFVI